ncbi:MAG: ketoacyl-ACP synthase III [Holosporaceae bacterium]|jgi:3-oxoacyl-[acyl-carrier-protein] synthase-3|nr:ketoacyl-ACP synthase III [Holosporaceae bacterium]
MKAVPIGLGVALPKKCLQNADLPHELNTSDEWIIQRTGIRQRYLAEGEETTASLATEAARKALADARVSPQDVDLIIVGTVTGDYTFPSTASMVQKNLGVTRGVAFDVSAACSGFVFALDIADFYIRQQRANTALVIGAETFSRILDWTDRTTSILFGDGAGALLLRAQDETNRGVDFCRIYSDGRFSEYLMTTGGISTTGNAGFVVMSGREVFRFAIEKFCEALNELLAANDMKINDVDLLVPHQANIRIIHKLIEISGIDEKKVVINVDKYANTSAASIPLALNDAREAFFSGGNTVLLSMGAGFTWGSALIRL